MSEIWIPAAGGGADLDVVTAQAGDVLQDKVIVGPDGEPLTGTMPNRGNYNGSGNSKGNDTGNQRMWVKVPQGYYNENAQVFLSWADIRAMAGITADKIKKNVSIIGITGTFEGWVPEPTDLYYNGVNKEIVGLGSVAQFQDTRVYIKDIVDDSDDSTLLKLFHASFDVTRYDKLIIEGLFKGYLGRTFHLTLYIPNTVGFAAEVKGTNATTLTFNISQISKFGANTILGGRWLDTGSYFTRIRIE